MTSVASVASRRSGTSLTSAGAVRRPSITTPAREPIEIVLVGHAEDARLVDARDAVARMRQPRREVAVVGQQQQAFGVEVEPSDRVDVLAHAAQQIDHRRPPLRIRSRRDVAARLVQQEIAMALDELDAAAVDADVVARRARPSSRARGRSRR